jgi:hypothetical protein
MDAVSGFAWGFALLSLAVWYYEFRQRAREGSTFQLIQRSPRVARLSPRRRQVAAHLGITVPTGIALGAAILLILDT